MSTASRCTSFTIHSKGESKDVHTDKNYSIAGHPLGAMATPESLAEAVKAAITSGSTSPSTVTTLQTLLGSVPVPGSQLVTTGRNAKTTATSRTAKPAKSTKPAARASKKDQDFQIHQDNTRSLPPKARYALATEVINLSLKVLSAAVVDKTKAQKRLSSTAPSSDAAISRRSSRTSLLSQRALQLRSGNATPVRQSPTKQLNSPRTPSQCSAASGSSGASHLTAIAECARIGFSLIGSTDARKLSVKALPNLQLESGMLSLVGILINLRLDALAIKELRRIKRRLESYDSSPAKKPSSGPKTTEHETLASLLQITVDFAIHSELLPVAITYQLHALRMIILSQRPATIEEACQYLKLETRGSPAELLVFSTNGAANKTKVARQLEALAQNLLQLCPSISRSADEAATDHKRSPSPLIVFQLQTLALRVRQEAWRIGDQPVNQKEIVEPFSKCMNTLVRRLPSPKQASAIYEACTAAHCALGIPIDGGDEADYTTIARTLAILADEASLPDRSSGWARIAIDSCRGLESTHTRHLAAMSLKLSLCHKMPESSYDLDEVLTNLRLVTQGLRGRLSGSKSDHEQLIVELSRLAGATFERFNDEQVRGEWKELVRSAAAFVPGYAKLFPGNGLQPALFVVKKALLHSYSAEDLISWVTKDTAHLFRQAGVLRTVAECASRMPMAQAWSSSNTTIAFGRTLRAIVLKAASTENGKYIAMLFDEEDLEPDESGASLEWQLNCALEIAHKPKYQKAMQVLIPHMFHKLLMCYRTSIHPLRISRVASLALRIREQFPEILPMSTLEPFLDLPRIDVDSLGKDTGLRNYALDVTASLGISLAFHHGPAAMKDLVANLQIWQDLMESSEQNGSIEQVVDDTATLLLQLKSLEEYAAAMGDDLARLRLASMLFRAGELCEARADDRYYYSMKVCMSYLSLGHAERAQNVLEKSGEIAQEGTCTGIVKLEYYLTKAECLLAMDQVEECQKSLDMARESRSNLEPHKVKSHQSKTYKLLHGRGWLLQSQCFLAAGLPHDALRAAKRSCRVVNSIWAGIERAAGHRSQSDVSELEKEPEDQSMETLSQKVSKLNLKPAGDDSRTSSKAEVRCAALWPVARLLCQALMHLSDMYAHHGIFNEANYSSEQAMRIAQSIQSTILLSRVCSHRGILLAAAGRIEDAELCLAQHESSASSASVLASVERLRAKCALSFKSCDLDDAVKYIDDAATIMRDAQSGDDLVEIDRKATEGGIPSRRAAGPKAALKIATRPGTTRSAPRTRTVPKTSRGVVFDRTNRESPPAGTSSRTVTQQGDKSTCYMLEKLEAQLIVQRATILLKLGKQDKRVVPLDDALARLPVSFSRCQFEHQSTMRKVMSTLEADFAFNILPESALSFPAVRRMDASEQSQASTTAKSVTKSMRPVKGAKRKVSSNESLESMLLTARQWLMPDHSAARVLATFDIHKQYSMLSNTAMLLSVTAAGNEASTLHPIREALTIDYPRIHAAQCQLAIADLEKEAFQTSDLLNWPISSASKCDNDIGPNDFQDNYVNILPRPWTAVSLGLSQDCDELYITRYRRGQAPIILRLPFSRQKSEDADEEIFDFHVAREELEEIIELSNYSCHNSLDTAAKGAKNNWWSEREALDLRLHELLLNMENIWLGGFRGAFSQHVRDSDQLSRFRKDFETILDRHLPSRRSNKRGMKKLCPDDQVLELFIGLGSDQEGDMDLDEPLSDLLYFVVDMLQFGGEPNAYDEVDFDSMAIEVLDVLRSYHDNLDDGGQEGAHLILVLDRRLQAFPWESLPCLQNVSVSRVDSMLCLRDRILEMRRRFGSDKDVYTVSRQSGSYILNPSSDLKNTETALTPELSKLAQAVGAKWNAIVRRAPTEDDFGNALTTSSTLLYFGHGAGSQYIRPRTIRRLEKCSEVVWLMGCSSGAVTEHDELEAFAVPMAYLVAGYQSKSPSSKADEDSSKCMCILATLWDVTDKDIDRFSLAVGEEWGLWSSAKDCVKATSKTPRKREAVAAPLTPQRGAKTPKTPKVRRTPAPSRTPARSRSRARDADKKQSLVQAVTKSRDACYLRYLNGAAPVVYGVPVYLGE